MKSQAKNVDAYLQEVPENRRDALQRLRKLCLELMPDYEENLEYGMPGYKRPGGEIEMGFASQKNYISVYLLKQDVLDKYRPELKGLNVGKGCIRYSSPKKMDFTLLIKMLADHCQSDAEIC